MPAVQQLDSNVPFLRRRRTQKEKENIPRARENLRGHIYIATVWIRGLSNGQGTRARANRVGMLTECTDTLPADRRAAWYLTLDTPQHREHAFSLFPGRFLPLKANHGNRKKHKRVVSVRLQGLVLPRQGRGSGHKANSPGPGSP